MAQVQQVIDTETNEVLTSRKLQPNANFVQFYRNEMHSIRELIATEPKAAALFMLITENMDTENALVASKETLAEYLDVSVRTISRQVALLKQKGFIDIMKSGVSNVYLVNANIAWSTNGTKKQFAKFKANVLISKSEQEYRVKATRTKQINLQSKK